MLLSRGCCSLPLLVCTLLLLLVQLVAFGDAAKGKVSCGDIRNNVKLERDVAKLMVLTEHGRLYPENRKDLKVFCE